MVIKYESFPQSWSFGYISPIFKGGDSGDLANYRPITVTSNLSKVFTHIMNQRLMNFLNSNNLLRPEQIGFRKGCSTSDHLFVLETIIDSFKSKRKPLYTCFIDLSKAFDSVWRDAMYYKLLKLGISCKFVKIIQSMYQEVKSQVKVQNVLSENI